MEKVTILDMAASEERHFLYLATPVSVILYRLRHSVLDPDYTQWETECITTGLSVIESRCGNVLVTCSDLNVVREYQPNGGKLIREVSLSSEIRKSYHAIELTSNRSVFFTVFNLDVNELNYCGKPAAYNCMFSETKLTGECSFCLSAYQVHVVPVIWL